ncbi:MAG: hypothetical protein KAQ99_08615 [Candidatus Aureabacteria bacterium]|nr:hypothetical protein [Candidatus Auribacterota bacterium]
MKRNWIVTAFYTRDKPGAPSYKKVAEKYLLPSLAKLGIHCDLQIVENRGSWLANIAHKPEVIEKALNAYKSVDVNVVYIDVDAVVELYPSLFDCIDEKYYIAAHRLDRIAWYGLQNSCVKPELFNGTIFLRNNQKTRDFVADWKERCKDVEVWEPTHFKKAIENTGIKCFDLPLSYAYIYSLPDGSKPLIELEHVYIRHHQASREHRGGFRNG